MDRRRSLRAAALTGLGLLTAVLAGCGAEDATDAAVAGVGSGPAPGSEVAGLPSVSVLDLTTGEEVVLSSYLPADRPVLVWMWSPY